MKQFVLTTAGGLESIAKKEVEKQGGKIIEVRDRYIAFEGDDATMIRVNLWSRVGNKVYQLLTVQQDITDFDAMYESMVQCDWKSYIPEGFQVFVQAKEIRSQLSAEHSIQKIAKRAIVDAIAGKGGYLQEDKKVGSITVQILIFEDALYVMLDTSGDGLYRRGYRVETGEAPLKENLAAALVLLSGWRFKEPLYDPFCGSGTIVIEAAMIAKNIAPGLNRHFAFQDWTRELYDLKCRLIDEAQKKQFVGDYRLMATDIDAEIIEVAKENAGRAGVADMIMFKEQDVTGYLDEQMQGTLVSNPPYGLRLQGDDLEQLYHQIYSLFQQNEGLNGGVITSFEGNDDIMKPSQYKKRKLYNGGEKCYFYKRK